MEMNQMEIQLKVTWRAP